RGGAGSAAPRTAVFGRRQADQGARARSGAQGQGARGDGGTARSQKKDGGALGGRGRRHGPEERQVTVANIDEAVAAGATQAAACELVGIDERTVQRWRARPDGVDQRRGPKTRPANTLSAAEEGEVLALVTSKEFVGLSPHQLVAKLADLGTYLASEATIYRLLRRHRLL